MAVQRSRLNALKRLYRRTTEPHQRGRLGSLYRRKLAEYKRAILRAKRVQFRRFISEGLTTDRLGVVCGVVKGKWKPKVSERLVTPSGVEVSTWAEVQAELARYHFRQADDVLEKAPNRPG